LQNGLFVLRWVSLEQCCCAAQQRLLRHRTAMAERGH
jgi:hypothetical protein